MEVGKTEEFRPTQGVHGGAEVDNYSGAGETQQNGFRAALLPPSELSSDAHQSLEGIVDGKPAAYPSSCLHGPTLVGTRFVNARAPHMIVIVRSMRSVRADF